MASIAGLDIVDAAKLREDLDKRLKGPFHKVILARNDRVSFLVLRVVMGRDGVEYPGALFSRSGGKLVQIGVS